MKPKGQGSYSTKVLLTEPIIVMLMIIVVIASMSVKEVLQSLVDDDMVDSERIGTSTYFWAFPSKASMKVCSASYRYSPLYG